MYRVLDLSKQAVFQQAKKQQIFDDKLSHLVQEAEELRQAHPGCGVEKMYYTLQPDFIGRDRFIEFFMEVGFRVFYPKNYTKTTIPTHYHYPNLISGMLVNGINQVVQSDITYFSLHQKFYYIIFLIDVFSKRIVGYQVSDHMRASANLKALQQLIDLRGKADLKHLIHHSDRGTQYGSKKYVYQLNELNCYISMGESAQDNAYAERVNGIIKNEYLKLWTINSFYMLRKKLAQAVKHYNEVRPHRHLPNKMSPVQFENILANANYDKEHLELIFARENHYKRPFCDLFDFPKIHSNQFFCPLG